MTCPAGMRTSTNMWEKPVGTGNITDEYGSHLLGRRDTNSRRDLQESLLVYQRPLDEHGEIEYEFYFEPASTMCIRHSIDLSF